MFTGTVAFRKMTIKVKQYQHHYVSDVRKYIDKYLVLKPETDATLFVLSKKYHDYKDSVK